MNKNFLKILSFNKIPIKEILIEPNLGSKANDLINKIGFLNQKILLIADQNTYPILGEEIFNSLNKSTNNQNCQKLILQSPKAEESNVLKIIDRALNCQLIIAVGSGTINDLCKLASFRRKIPYVIFATAPSMNGYCSANASIEINGRKTSVQSTLPKAAYFDLNIISNSPERLIKAGIGDSLCFSTCQFDWLLSHLILQTPYNQSPFDLLKPYYQKLINLENIYDREFIKTLCQTLIISGLGMYIAKGSYPASQAEHLIAHYIEIKYPEIAQNSYHGEQIAITTLTICKIQEKILSYRKIKIKASDAKKEDLEKIFDQDLANYFYKEIKNKIIDADLAKQINLKLEENWPVIKDQLENCFVQKSVLLKIYKKFSLPKNPKEIAIGAKAYLEATKNAYLIRNRFTSLDFIQLISNNENENYS